MSSTIDTNTLRATFNEFAEVYDQYRQRYPSELFKGLVSMVGLTSQCRVLEIGPGTGQATLPLSQLIDPHMIAVELGENLAAIARQNLAAFPKVEIITCAFEQWPLPHDKFDLAFSATAWHWIDPTMRVQKCAEALRSSGSLVVIETYHVRGGTLEFFKQVQDIYERFGLAKSPDDARLPESTEIDEPSLVKYFGDRHFKDLQFARYEWDQEYTWEGYLGLLSTYSNHIALGNEGKNAMFAEIEELIKVRFDGRVVKRFMVQLIIVRKI
jgi:SAM-dependent methyltransferase